VTASTGSGPATPVRRRGGPPLLFAVLAVGSLVLGALLILVSALGIGIGPGASPTIPPTGQAAQLTRDIVAEALGAASFQVQDPRTEYRPGETADLSMVPRRLLQAVLPDEPQGGYVVVYELPSNGEADRIGRDFAAYLASGTGAIQYPRDTKFVIRRQGSTLVFFAWSPTADADPRVADMAAALETVGVPLTDG
jgi:hypothetical protein